jgi:hypothetical protein
MADEARNNTTENNSDPGGQPLGMDFSWALKRIKEGQMVQRAGWNGKGMWIVLVMPTILNTELQCGGPAWIIQNIEGLGHFPFIGMKTADNMFVPWLASQTDLLANDWQFA